MRDERYGRKCFVCNRGFTVDEWDERHDVHEEGCSGEGCDCDHPVHAAHCPACDDTADRAVMYFIRREDDAARMETTG